MTAATAAEIAIAILLLPLPAAAAEEPYSCQQYRVMARQCSYNTVGPCYVQKEVDRLRQECLRAGGNP